MRSRCLPLVLVVLAGCTHATTHAPTHATANATANATAGTQAPQARTAVEQVYLAWWGARQAAYLTLDPGSLRAFATAAGVAVDQQRMDDLRTAGHLLQLSAEHSLQAVVYRDGATASVDDVWVNHSVELDAAARTPIGPDPGYTVHESTTLRRQAGRWLVDGVYSFGTSIILTGQPMSWAAVAGGKPLPDFYRKPIEDAYLQAAHPGADPGPEHNDRVAIEQDSVAWVYDTIATSGAISHAATRLVQEAGAWRVQAA